MSIRFLRSVFAAAAAWLLLAILEPRRADACSCQPLPTVALAAEGAEVIFVASPQVSQRGVTARVKRVYKGDVPSSTVLGIADCPSIVDRLLGGATPDDILVYGYRIPGDIVIPKYCSRSAFVAERSEDMASLEKSFPPRAPSSGAVPQVTPVASEAAPVTDPTVGKGNAGSAPSGVLIEADAPPPVEPRARSGCACGVGASDDAPGASVLGFALLTAALRRRRRGSATEVGC